MRFWVVVGKVTRGKYLTIPWVNLDQKWESLTQNERSFALFSVGLPQSLSAGTLPDVLGDDRVTNTKGGRLLDFLCVWR